MVAGSAVHGRIASYLTKLRDARLRLVEVETPSDVEVVAVSHQVVGLRITEYITAERLIEPSGVTKDEKTYADPLQWTALLQQDNNGRWFIASIEPLE